jgi:hypothetical protein
VPEILRAAHRHIPFGTIFTNGTKRIPSDIGYRIHVSIWGGSKTAKAMRGADTNQKAFRNFAGDPKALFVMVLNPLNLFIKQRPMRGQPGAREKWSDAFNVWRDLFFIPGRTPLQQRDAA